MVPEDFFFSNKVYLRGKERERGRQNKCISTSVYFPKPAVAMRGHTGLGSLEINLGVPHDGQGQTDYLSL